MRQVIQTSQIMRVKYEKLGKNISEYKLNDFKDRNKIFYKRWSKLNR